MAAASRIPSLFLRQQENPGMAVGEPRRPHWTGLLAYSSPDCNSLHFFVSIAVEREANRSSCNTENELKIRITTASSGLKRETVTKDYGRVRSRLDWRLPSTLKAGSSSETGGACLIVRSAKV